MEAELTIEREARMPEVVPDDAMIESMRAKVGVQLRSRRRAMNPTR